MKQTTSNNSNSAKSNTDATNNKIKNSQTFNNSSNTNSGNNTNSSTPNDPDKFKRNLTYSNQDDIYRHDETKEKSFHNFIFKLVIIGESSVGKTNIINRFVNNKFTETSRSTIGVALSTKEHKIQDENVTVQIWDTAGQERFNSITSHYYRGAKAAMIVYDITDRNSFNRVDNWYKELTHNCSVGSMALMLIGNKVDLEENRKVDFEEAVSKAKELSKKYT